jgi:hypothetical protein
VPIAGMLCCIYRNNLTSHRTVGITTTRIIRDNGEGKPDFSQRIFAKSLFLPISSSKHAFLLLDSTAPSPNLFSSLANAATATLSGPDTILFQCVGEDAGNVAVTNSQLIAMQVNGIN